MNSRDAAEQEMHRRLAADVFGLKFDTSLQAVSDRNVLSLSSKKQCFAKRLDSRAYFIETFEWARKRRPYPGSDEEQLHFSRKLLRRLEIPDDEIANQQILREFGQSAKLDPKTGSVIQLKPSHELGNSVFVERAVDGLPVWSSHLRFELAGREKIAWLEMHWPKIPDEVLEGAKRLAWMVDNGWQAPEVPQAKVESVEAGIVHTPAIGYFFDVHAAVRVIYAALDPGIGRKPTYHLDRHGDPVLLRSTAELLREPPLSPREAPRLDTESN